MTEPRRPSWGHNAYEMARSMGRLKRCKDGCGAIIALAQSPNGAWIPLEKVGEIPNPDRIDEPFHDVIIHHDVCTNPRVEGNRDPRISHRIAKNEYEGSIAEEQVQFRPHIKLEG